MIDRQNVTELDESTQGTKKKQSGLNEKLYDIGSMRERKRGKIVCV